MSQGAKADENPLKPVEEIALEDGRYHYRLFELVWKSIDADYIPALAKKQHCKDKHVSPADVVEGVIAYAQMCYCSMAWTVYEMGCIPTPEEIGDIVELLWKEGWLNKHEDDDWEDFRQYPVSEFIRKLKELPDDYPGIFEVE